ALRAAGYDTAITGKWHLGSKPEWGPRQFGFDHSYGSLAGGVGPLDHRYKKGPFTETWHRDDKLIEEQGHVTDLITQEAVRWIESRTEKPFFLYLTYTAPHIPMDEPKAWLDRYPDIGVPTKRQFAACVSHMDDGIGQVVRALERAGKRENTLIVFTSDNGATPNVRNDDTQYPGSYPPGPAGGSNEPLRGQKAQLYEGGIRVPALVNWPGKLKPSRFAAPIHVVDWMPTLCALAGSQASSDLKWDGQDVWPTLTGAVKPTPRQLYWAGPGFKTAAARDGDWKLIIHRGETEKAELFDLASDPCEKTDLAAQHPERVAALKKLLAELSARDNDMKETEA
ncbi:MAG: sulfatase, partial [Planctomycetes bacterium]|nr:sulfatase [Planctomycetota bacterium]